MTNVVECRFRVRGELLGVGVLELSMDNASVHCPQNAPAVCVGEPTIRGTIRLMRSVDGWGDDPENPAGLPARIAPLMRQVAQERG